MANLPILKNNKAKGIRFGTLQSICQELDYQPKDIIEYETFIGTNAYEKN